MTNPSAVPKAPDGDTTAAPEDLRLALRAATLYYLDGLTQAQVADRLGVSRATAGRLVARARSHGLVRIEVTTPPHLRDDLHADIEHALEERFGLTEAVVVGVRVDDRGPVDNSASFAVLGRAAASLLTRRLRPADTLGFTWAPKPSLSPRQSRRVSRRARRSCNSTAPSPPAPTRPAPSTCWAAAPNSFRPNRFGSPPPCTPTRRPSRPCAPTR